MSLLLTFRIAIRALGRNKMRSILTMLGIIIGVGAVIAMVGIGRKNERQPPRHINCRRIALRVWREIVRKLGLIIRLQLVA